MKKRAKTGPPARQYLIPIKDDFPRGEKCEHDPRGGRWLVEWEGKLYGIDPPTGFQKDTWLSTVKYEEGEARYEEAVAALLWFCFGCGNVQKP
jgi:hypothetical protein